MCYSSYPSYLFDNGHADILPISTKKNGRGVGGQLERMACVLCLIKKSSALESEIPGLTAVLLDGSQKLQDLFLRSRHLFLVASCY